MLLFILILIQSFSFQGSFADSPKTKPLTIFKALINEDEASITAIVRKNPKVFLERDNRGESPLGLAAQMGNLAMAKLLIKLGADVNGTTGKENCPILFFHDKEMTELLISSGANPNARDSFGETILMSEVANEGAPADFPNPHENEKLEYLLSHGADPKLKSEDGKTALHKVARAAVVKLLIQKGADINARDLKGNTPLMSILAFNVESAKYPVAKAMVEQGADVHLKNQAGETAFDLTTDPRLKALLNKSGGTRGK